LGRVLCVQRDRRLHGDADRHFGRGGPPDRARHVAASRQRLSWTSLTSCSARSSGIELNPLTWMKLSSYRTSRIAGGPLDAALPLPVMVWNACPAFFSPSSSESKSSLGWLVCTEMLIWSSSAV